MRTPASARMCAESQICTAFVLIGTKPTLVQNGGYRLTTATSNRHAARLLFQSASEPSADSARLD
jgi:hypothetical protein